jgi:hypothetical protein
MQTESWFRFACPNQADAESVHSWQQSRPIANRHKKSPVAVSNGALISQSSFCGCVSRLPATATTTTAATTATAEAAATTTTAATTTAGALTFLRFINTQRTTAHVLAIQRLDGASSIGIGHFNETEATGTSRFAVIDESNRSYGAVRFEHLTHFTFIRGKRQIANIDLRHTNTSL